MNYADNEKAILPASFWHVMSVVHWTDHLWVYGIRPDQGALLRILLEKYLFSTDNYWSDPNDILVLKQNLLW